MPEAQQLQRLKPPESDALCCARDTMAFEPSGYRANGEFAIDLSTHRRTQGMVNTPPKRIKKYSY